MERSSGRMPEYKRVADDLQRRIGPEFQVGDYLPSLPQLEEHYGVSTNIIRRALVDLRLLGLVSTQHGIGTLVLAEPGERNNASPEYQKIMKLIGRLQEQIDGLSEQVTDLRRQSASTPPTPDSESGHPSA